jgi:rod shape-determining protein MreC
MGIASGNSMGPVKIKYMSSNADVRVGDKIITSGMSDIFPKGIIVGFVRSIDKKDYDVFQKVEVSPAVRFSRLDKVFVVAK